MSELKFRQITSHRCDGEAEEEEGEAEDEKEEVEEGGEEVLLHVTSLQ